jgi:hypothetical protein
MMFTPLILSGSTSGRPILIAATGTPGTLIHTAIVGASSFDEVIAYFTNTSGSAVDLTIEFGGVTSPNDHVVKTISLPPFSPPMPLLTRQRINGGLAVRAFASTANVIVVTGGVDRIS